MSWAGSTGVTLGFLEATFILTIEYLLVKGHEPRGYLIDASVISFLLGIIQR